MKKNVIICDRCGNLADDRPAAVKITLSVKGKTTKERRFETQVDLCSFACIINFSEELIREIKWITEDVICNETRLSFQRLFIETTPETTQQQAEVIEC